MPLSHARIVSTGSLLRLMDSTFSQTTIISFIFNPLSIQLDRGLPSLRKVLRWSVLLSRYNYICLHIKGIDNVWANLLTRWDKPITIRRLIFIPPLINTESKNCIRPITLEIQQKSADYCIRPPNKSTKKEGLLVTTQGAQWIPPEAAALHLRICVIAHTSTAEHRGRNVTLFHVQKNFI